MLRVIPLRYGTAFKKAFGDPQVFTAFVRDVLELDLSFDEVQQELAFHPPVGKIDVRFDLFAEDSRHRAIVELQHVRGEDAFARFHYYHLVSQIEQVRNAKSYGIDRTVYTIVVLTRLPREDRLRFDVATQSSDFHTLDGRALQVLDHRIVMLNPRALTDTTPPRIRRWLELIEDSLDEFVDETQYPEPELRKVLDSIEADGVTPQERYRYIEEAVWEQTKTDEREEGREEGRKEGREEGARAALRAAIVALAQVLALELTPARADWLASASADELQALQTRLVNQRRWEDEESSS